MTILKFNEIKWKVKHLFLSKWQGQKIFDWSEIFYSYKETCKVMKYKWSKNGETK